jgi:hypothetical protein
MSDLTPRPVPLDQTRQRVIDQLIDHYAVENLDDRGLEDRLGKAVQATTVADLQALLADLPTAAVQAPLTAVGTDVARADYVPSERQIVAAVMGGAERKGPWTPPKELVVIGVMGGAELDFREARFGPGVTEVNCFVLMGGVEIVVPPGVHVEMNGLAVMGAFVSSGSATGPAPPGAPILRIGGFAMMGGVDVQVRYPGEKSGDAKRRERLERKEARDHHRLGRGF